MCVLVGWIVATESSSLKSLYLWAGTICWESVGAPTTIIKERNIIVDLQVSGLDSQNNIKL